MATMLIGILLMAGGPGFAGTTRAADPPAVLALHRLEAPVRLDGLIDEAAWEAVPPLPMTMYRPTYGEAPTERTEIRLAYDEEYLYASGRFYDADPAGIRANSLYRDERSGSDDFTLVLDTFNDNENALLFWTTPAGLRGDMALSADGRSSNLSWNTYWDVVTSQDEQGWYAEMRIPFSSLGFQDEGGRVVMGVIASRLIARKNEQVLYPAIEPSWAATTPSRAADVVLEGVYSHKPVYVTPYLLGGLGQAHALDGMAYRRDDTFTQDVGLDVKYNVTSNLTLDVTVNTDFAQAEADDQQVNLTRFSLFFPEKRAFFQERSGIFAFNTQNERLFHSRRIGLQQGRAVPILGGARLVGRVGAWDVGLMNLQTAREGTLDLPSENFGILRLRRQVFNPNSVAGGIVTSRVGMDGSYNLAYGLDGVFRVVGDEYLTLNWAQTFDDALPHDGPADALRAGLFELTWVRRHTQGWSYNTALTWMGPDYRPDVGFVRRQDYAEWSWLLHYNDFPGAGSAFNRTMPFHLQGAVARRNADGTVESASADYLAWFWWKTGSSAGVTASVAYEDLRFALNLPEESGVPVGRYTFVRGNAFYRTPSGHPFELFASTTAGTFYDGWRLDVSAGPQWNASRHLSLSASYNLNRVRFADRDQGFDAHIIQLRLQTALDTKASAHAFVQYNSAFDVVTANVRLRYNVREGNDLWLVYNEGLNTDRTRFDPILPFSDQRTLLLKYTHTVGL